MSGETVRERIVVVAVVSAAVVIVALLVLSADYLASPDETEQETRRPDPSDYVTPEERHRGLDTPVVHGVRLMGFKGAKQVEIGSFEVRRKKVGFLRVGALNEAVIRDLRVVVDTECFLTRLVPALRALGAARDSEDGRPGTGAAGSPVSRGHGSTRDHPAAGGTSRHAPQSTDIFVNGQSPRLISEVLGKLWQHSPHRDQKVSSYTIRGFSVVLANSDGAELCLLRCDGIVPRSGQGCGRLLLRGNVIIRSVNGERLWCEEADLDLSGECCVTASGPTISIAGEMKRFDRLSFPLAFLVREGGSFEDFLSEGPEPTYGSASPKS